MFGVIIGSVVLLLSIRWCYDRKKCCLCCYNKGGRPHLSQGERIPETSICVEKESVEDNIAGDNMAVEA